MINPPKFWWRRHTLLGALLWPLSLLYGYFSARAMKMAKPVKLEVPVVCVGNFTLGGSGKTPFAMSLANGAKQAGFKPGFISRGFARKSKEIYIVDYSAHSAQMVGDEPLLLAQNGLVAVGADRLKCARALMEKGCNFIIMDDGFQSRQLHFDYALMMVDGGRGLGNGRVFPAGPLRAPLATQLSFSDEIVVIETVQPRVPLGINTTNLISKAHTNLRTNGDLAAGPLIAFAAIGNPDKFFASITSLGGNICEQFSFPDHHFYSQKELEILAQKASAINARLVTTPKDWVRITKDERLSASFLAGFLEKLMVLEIDIVFPQDDYIGELVGRIVNRFAQNS